MARYKARPAAGEYVSFGQGNNDRAPRRGVLQSAKAGRKGAHEVSDYGQDNRLAVPQAHESDVFERLSQRDASSDSHCHHKHPENWRWQSSTANALATHKPARANSGLSHSATSAPEDNFKIRVVPMDKSHGR